MIDKDAMYEIAQGRIENPSVDISANGQTMRFLGTSARDFAIGYLTGLRDATSGDIEFNNEVDKTNTTQ